jgi:integrase
MPIYKRIYTENGKKKGIWWFSFYWNGKHIQKSTGLPVGPKGNPQKARNAESECRAMLNKGMDAKSERAKELGCTAEDLIRCPQCEKLFDRRVAVAFDNRNFCGKDCADKWNKDHNPPPALREFAQQFIDSIQVRCAKKPATVRFYAEKLQTLLKFEPLANARLDQIDEALIESYVQEASKQAGRIYTEVAPATINRRLATLRRALRLAYAWKLIDRIPKVQLLKGEGNREFVLNHADEEAYLNACPQPLWDIALTILDCGLRTGEVLNLEWCNVHLEPAPGARYGYIHIADGKSKNARRNVPVTDRVARMLMGRSLESKSAYVFPSETGRPYRVTSIDHDHAEARAALGDACRLRYILTEAQLWAKTC